MVVIFLYFLNTGIKLLVFTAGGSDFMFSVLSFSFIRFFTFALVSPWGSLEHISSNSSAVGSAVLASPEFRSSKPTKQFQVFINSVKISKLQN